MKNSRGDSGLRKSLRVLKRALDVSPMDLVRKSGGHGRRLLSKSREGGLTSRQAAELELMRADNRVAGPPFAASLHWQEVTRIYDDEFKREGVFNPEEQLLNLRLSGFLANDPRLHRYVCWMYRTILQGRDSLNLLSTLPATCKEGRGFGYRMDGDYISLDLLFSIDDFYNLYELNPAIATEPVIVGELGAGWGRLAYVVQKVNPKSTYLIFDLPEVLLISQTYLGQLFSNDKHVPYSVGRTRQHGRRALAENRFWFLGPQHLPKCEPGSLDFFVNVASFQEMPRSYVTEYLKLASKVATGGRCYMRELRSGAAHGHRLDEIAGIEEYDFPSDWRIKFNRSSILSDEFFEAGFEIPQATAVVAK